MRYDTTLYKLLMGSIISRVELVYDHESEEVVNHWFVVALELPGDGSHVQTVELTVTWDHNWHNLSKFLEENGWLDQVDMIAEFHQGYGHGVDCSVRTFKAIPFRNRQAKEQTHG